MSETTTITEAVQQERARLTRLSGVISRQPCNIIWESIWIVFNKYDNHINNIRSSQPIEQWHLDLYQNMPEYAHYHVRSRAALDHWLIDNHPLAVCANSCKANCPPDCQTPLEGVFAIKMQVLRLTILKHLDDIEKLISVLERIQESP